MAAEFMRGRDLKEGLVNKAISSQYPNVNMFPISDVFFYPKGRIEKATRKTDPVSTPPVQ